MYAYFMPEGNCPRWALVLAVTVLSHTVSIVDMGEMPGPEPGITLITNEPIPDSQLKSFHLLALE